MDNISVSKSARYSVDLDLMWPDNHDVSPRVKCTSHSSSLGNLHSHYQSCPHPCKAELYARCVLDLFRVVWSLGYFNNDTRIYAGLVFQVCCTILPYCTISRSEILGLSTGTVLHVQSLTVFFSFLFLYRRGDARVYYSGTQKGCVEGFHGRD